MSRQRHHWQIRRQMSEQADGWPRWDRAYQAVLSWTGCQMEPKRDSDPTERQIQEKCHAYRDVCASIYPNSSSGPNH
jgi:hypothetical protein